MADASEGFATEFSSTDEGSDRESEGTDHDSDSTRAPDPKRTYRGSALYNTKYDHAWRDSYPCVKNDAYSFPLYYLQQGCVVQSWVFQM